MKHTLFFLACIVPFLFGPLACRPQQPVTPPVFTCPPAGNGAYVTLNPVGSATNPPTTAMSYTDTPGGNTCYVVQGYLAASGNGPWSSVAGPYVGGPTGKLGLSWSCTPGTGTTCTGVKWLVSSVPAVSALAPATPNMNAPTTSELQPPPIIGPQDDPNIGCAFAGAKHPCIKALAATGKLSAKGM